MLNHTRISTVSAAIIVLLSIHFLSIDYVTGFREQKRLMYDAYSREIGEKSKEAHYLYVTAETNDVIRTQRDVTDEQEVSSSSPCPTDCWCSYLYVPNPWLEIRCDNRSTNASSLLYEINAYLLGVVWNFTTNLLIHTTPLTAVPESVCQLKGLTGLNLGGNPFLTTLPDNCFTRLRELQIFGAAACGLTSLQNGLFDNLTKLSFVTFQRNNISSIGAHLFDVTANLPNLRDIYLLENNLKEIDTWPVKRAQLFRKSRIDLSKNHILRFTNSLGWHYDCDSAPLLSPVKLTYNNITHLKDLLGGWNITGLFCHIHSRS